SHHLPTMFLLVGLLAVTCTAISDNDWPKPVPDSAVPVNSDYGTKSDYTRGGLHSISCPFLHDFLIQSDEGTPFRTISLGNVLHNGAGIWGGAARWVEHVLSRYNFGGGDKVKVSCISPSPNLFDSSDCNFLYTDRVFKDLPAYIRPRTFKCSGSQKMTGVDKLNLLGGGRADGDSVNCTKAMFGNSWKVINGKEETTVASALFAINC
ncbi:hypothetical protein PFISCL1PPCAC_12231, partial [Pristionchus fissidentatus]